MGEDGLVVGPCLVTTTSESVSFSVEVAVEAEEFGMEAPTTNF